MKATRVPESNRQQFRFQAVRIRMAIIWQFRFYSRNCIIDYDFNIISISFWLNPPIIDLFLVKNLKKSIKRLKKVDRKNKIVKIDGIWSKKVWKSQFIFFFYKHFQSNFLIKIKIVHVFHSCWNQFCRNHSDSEDKFGSKKLIKRWFKSDLSQNLALSWFNRLSLIQSKSLLVDSNLEPI